MFVCLHFFFEFLLYFFVLPKLNHIIYYQMFWLLILSLFISFYIINKSDPGFIEPKDNLTWLEMVENNMNINEYCPYCRVKKTKRIKHCHICKKCIKGFDHHCNWIDNCVGENNKKRFLDIIYIIFRIREIRIVKIKSNISIIIFIIIHRIIFYICAFLI